MPIWQGPNLTVQARKSHLDPAPHRLRIKDVAGRELDAGWQLRRFMALCDPHGVATRSERAGDEASDRAAAEYDGCAEHRLVFPVTQRDRAAGS